MAISLELDVTGALRKIRKVEEHFLPSTLTKRVGFDILDWIMENFEREGTEKPWKKLSPNTVAARRKGSSSILQDSGKLKQSFTDFGVQMEGDSALVGTRNEIAPIHEHGSKINYPIAPKNEPLLKFMTANGWRSSKGLTHPGIPQRKMLPSKVMAKKLAHETLQAILRELRGKVD